MGYLIDLHCYLQCDIKISDSKDGFHEPLKCWLKDDWLSSLWSKDFIIYGYFSLLSYFVVKRINLSNYVYFSCCQFHCFSPLCPNLESLPFSNFLSYILCCDLESLNNLELFLILSAVICSTFAKLIDSSSSIMVLL